MALLLPLPGTSAQTKLDIQYGSNGIQQLRYGGAVLEDLTRFPSDAFHIWHMKMTDLQGHPRTAGQYGWGENNNGRSWDAASHTWTYNFVWGSIRLQFLQSGNNLTMAVTEVNRAGSGVILDGATVYPFVLHLPVLPRGFHDPHDAQLSFNTSAPSVRAADFGSGEVVAVVCEAGRPLYSGFEPAGNGISYVPLISSTAPDSLARYQPHVDRPVPPGGTDTFNVSLRFAPSGTPLKALAADAYSAWARTWPALLHWSDRRPIGTVFLASSPSGDVHRPGGYRNNPRRYFNDSEARDFDITTTAGLAAFQRRILKQAQANVDNMKRLGAQGAVTWDVEGEQYPQDTSYVCSPDQIGRAAPEMESVIADNNSPFHGMKLDDAYFRIMTRAGFRVGVCVRPQRFTIGPEGTAAQTYLSDSEVEAELARKMQFAHQRWGATLFYVDSSVDNDGATLDADIFQKLAKAFPDSLIMPEESAPRHYAYTAPLLSFLFHGETGTDPDIYNYYPRAFSVNLINDADPGKLTADRPQLLQSVQHGDVLMGLVGFWQANDSAIDGLYRAAGTAPGRRRDPSHRR